MKMTLFLLLFLCAAFSATNGQHLRPRQLEETERRRANEGLSTAIVHIGPMKTGTTSIDMAAFRLQAELEEDGYRLAPFLSKDIDPATVVGCFVQESAKVHYSVNFTCNESALQETKEIATVHHRGILMSSEFFSNPDFEPDRLKEFVQVWDDVQIVAYYRRYYDYVVSFHNQFFKYQPVEKFFTMGQYLTAMSKGGQHPEHYYIMHSLNKYKEHFSNFRFVHMRNMPNNNGVEAFFCEAIPDAPRSCEKVRKASQRRLTVHNPSVPLVYRNMAHYAREMQLLQRDDIEAISKIIQERQENVLGLTSDDFDFKTCPTQEVLDWFLEESLAPERELFPDYFREVGEAEIRRDFQKYSTTKFCGNDAKAIVENDEGWREFFRSI